MSEFEIENDVLLKCNSEKERIVVPDGVKEIGQFVFCQSKAKEIVLPEGVEIIGKSAFNGVMNLEKIVLPNSLKCIEENAFSFCCNIKEIIIPKGVLNIGNFAFACCTELKYLILQKSVENIGHSLFYGCKKLALDIDKGNKNYEIKNDMLIDIKKGRLIHYFGDKESIKIENVKEICKNAFLVNKKSENIKTIIIEKGCESIGGSAFQNLINLTKIELPDTLKTLEENVFSGCENLKEILLPKNVEHIASSTFYGILKVRNKCGKIFNIHGNIYYKNTFRTKIKIDNENPNYEINGYYLVDKRNNCIVSYFGNEKNIYIDNFERIGKRAFAGCNAKSVVLKGVKVVGEKAFMNCHELEYFDFGADIEQIHNYLFYFCKKLQVIVLGNKLKVVAEKAFKNSSSILKEIVYDGTQREFKEIKSWESLIQNGCKIEYLKECNCD